VPLAIDTHAHVGIGLNRRLLRWGSHAEYRILWLSNGEGGVKSVDYEVIGVVVS